MAYKERFNTNLEFVDYMKKLCEAYNGSTGKLGKIKYMSSGTMSKLTTENMNIFKSWCPSAWENDKVENHIKPYLDKVGYYGADCNNIFKAIFWGLDTGKVAEIAKFNPNGPYVVRKSNGLGDIGANSFFDLCSNISSDMTSIIPGEMVWNTGHVGMYYGKINNVDFVIDVTISQGGLALNKMSNQSWKKHGRSPFVKEYVISQNLFDSDAFVKFFNTFNKCILIKKGDKGDNVKQMQGALNYANIKLNLKADKLELDGSFGEATDKLVSKFKAYYSIKELNVGIVTLGKLAVL